MRTPALSLALLLLAGCPVDPLALEIEDRWVLGANSVLDIVFVVDDSNSMAAAQGALAAIAPGMTAGLSGATLDWQIGVVTTDMARAERRGRLVGPVVRPTDGAPASTLAAQLRPGVLGSQLERGLAAAWAAVTPPLLTHENEGLLRPGARLALVVLSDEDDCSDEGALPSEEPSDCVSYPGLLVSVAEYAGRLRDLVAVPEDVALHALVETGLTEEFDGCGGNNVGGRYVGLARSLGGVVLPHCLDGATMTAELVAQWSDRRTALPLSRLPDPLSLSVTWTTDEGASVIPEDATRAAGWTWDEASNSVRLWGEAVAPVGAEVVVRYVVATQG